MAKSGIINDEDYRSVERMLVAQITSLKKAREARKQQQEVHAFDDESMAALIGDLQSGEPSQISIQPDPTLMNPERIVTQEGVISPSQIDTSIAAGQHYVDERSVVYQDPSRVMLGQLPPETNYSQDLDGMHHLMPSSQVAYDHMQTGQINQDGVQQRISTVHTPQVPIAPQFDNLPQNAVPSADMQQHVSSVQQPPLDNVQHMNANIHYDTSKTIPDNVAHVVTSAQLPVDSMQQHRVSQVQIPQMQTQPQQQVTEGMQQILPPNVSATPIQQYDPQQIQSDVQRMSTVQPPQMSQLQQPPQVPVQQIQTITSQYDPNLHPVSMAEPVQTQRISTVQPPPQVQQISQPFTGQQTDSNFQQMANVQTSQMQTLPTETMQQRMSSVQLPPQFESQIHPDAVQQRGTIQTSQMHQYDNTPADIQIQTSQSIPMDNLQQRISTVQVPNLQQQYEQPSQMHPDPLQRMSTVQPPQIHPDSQHRMSTVQPPQIHPDSQQRMSTVQPPQIHPDSQQRMSTVQPPQIHPDSQQRMSTVQPPQIHPDSQQIMSSVQPSQLHPDPQHRMSTVQAPPMHQDPQQRMSTIQPPQIHPDMQQRMSTVQPPQIQSDHQHRMSTVQTPQIHPDLQQRMSTVQAPQMHSDPQQRMSTVQPPQIHADAMQRLSTVQTPQIHPDAQQRMSTVQTPQMHPEPQPMLSGMQTPQVLQDPQQRLSTVQPPQMHLETQRLSTVSTPQVTHQFDQQNLQQTMTTLNSQPSQIQGETSQNIVQSVPMVQPVVSTSVTQPHIPEVHTSDIHRVSVAQAPCIQPHYDQQSQQRLSNVQAPQMQQANYEQPQTILVDQVPQMISSNQPLQQSQYECQPSRTIQQENEQQMYSMQQQQREHQIQAMQQLQEGAQNIMTSSQLNQSNFEHQQTQIEQMQRLSTVQPPQIPAQYDLSQLSQDNRQQRISTVQTPHISSQYDVSSQPIIQENIQQRLSTVQPPQMQAHYEQTSQPLHQENIQQRMSNVQIPQMNQSQLEQVPSSVQSMPITSQYDPQSQAINQEIRQRMSTVHMPHIPQSHYEQTAQTLPPEQMQPSVPTLTQNQVSQTLIDQSQQIQPQTSHVQQQPLPPRYEQMGHIPAESIPQTVTGMHQVQQVTQMQYYDQSAGLSQMQSLNTQQDVNKQNIHYQQQYDHQGYPPPDIQQTYPTSHISPQLTSDSSITLISQSNESNVTTHMELPHHDTQQLQTHIGSVPQNISEAQPNQLPPNIDGPNKMQRRIGTVQQPSLLEVQQGMTTLQYDQSTPSAELGRTQATFTAQGLSTEIPVAGIPHVQDTYHTVIPKDEPKPIELTSENTSVNISPQEIIQNPEIIQGGMPQFNQFLLPQPSQEPIGPIQTSRSTPAISDSAETVQLQQPVPVQPLKTAVTQLLQQQQPKGQRSISTVVAPTGITNPEQQQELLVRRHSAESIPVQNQELSSVDGVHEPSTENVLDDGSTSTQDGDGGTKRGPVKRRSRASGPKLQVLNVEAEGNVECQLDITKNKKVTFRFTMDEVVPQDIANNLMQEKLLGASQAELLVEQLNEVIKQLKENPTKLPVLEQPQSPARKPPAARVSFSYVLFHICFN
ncbi:hypothetical protein O3M35_001966 [Rhynocoris fuscipes]|uniref:Serine/threonine-protein kinase WNK CCTL2 domain-containing protein n=1 Tax=Rhynocoris fuscipes TaxID=488301 RepID=A0AAW1CSN4_9HEMI